MVEKEIYNNSENKTIEQLERERAEYVIKTNKKIAILDVTIQGKIILFQKKSMIIERDVIIREKSYD